MYRSVFTPTEKDDRISLRIPREWYGRDVEIIAFPVDTSETLLRKTAKNVNRDFKPIPSKYLFDTKKIRFSRDEANDYEQ